jgi:aryl-alcohol dehydrogenase-like predicted oxidoreductase
MTGKYRRDAPLPDSARAQRIQERYFDARNFELLDKMEEIGQAHEQGILQVALAWLLTQPLITAPIVGANSVDQLRDSLRAAGFRLNDAEMEALNTLSAWRE